MKGDGTRNTFKPEKHYSSVRMQQGRVQLDADWNEQTDICLRRERTTCKDVIDPCGVPRTGGGFEIGVIGEGSDTDLLISPGRIYVDGILCELEEATPVSIEAVEGTLNQVTLLTPVDARQFEEGRWVEMFADGVSADTVRSRITAVDPEAGRLTLEKEVVVYLQGATDPRLRLLPTCLTQPDYQPELEGVESLAGFADGVYLLIWS